MVRSGDDRPRTVKKPAKRQPARKPRPKQKIMQGSYRELLRGVVTLIEQGRISSVRSVNAVLTSTYWLVGRRIVEHEQSGAERAAYGETLLKRLAHDLTAELGRGFSERNLRADAPVLPGLANSADSVCEISFRPQFRRQCLRNPLCPRFGRHRLPNPSRPTFRCLGLITSGSSLSPIPMPVNITRVRHCLAAGPCDSLIAR